MSSESSSEDVVFDNETRRTDKALFDLTPRTSMTSPDIVPLWQDNVDPFSKSPPQMGVQTLGARPPLRREGSVRFEDVKSVFMGDEDTRDPSDMGPGETYTGPHRAKHSRRKVSLPGSQLASYVALMEERVRLLETRLQGLESQSPRARPEGVEEPSGWPTLKTEPHWMKWQEYLEPTSTRPESVIEVLIEKPHTNSRRMSLALSLGGKSGSMGFSTDSADTTRPIERIRIRSPHVISALQQVSEQTFNDPSCLTILRPFKILLLYEGPIKEYLADLEHKSRETMIQFADLDDAKSSQTLPSQEEAISHLRCLVDFMKDDMGHIFAQHRRLRSNDAETIAFADLWHLFAAGDLATTNDQDNPQIYRVSITPASDLFSNRRPIKKQVEKKYGDASQRAETVYTEESVSTLFVDCFNFDFNGHDFGPVEARFALMFYEGEKRITDLPLHPLRFRRDAETLKSRMLTRGMKFRDLCDIAHREYNGLSEAEPKEQIDSQVIIDVDLFYQQLPSSAPSLGLKSWVENESRIVTESCGIPGCTECFKGLVIYDDHRLDRQQTLDFTKTNYQFFTLVPDKDMLSDEQLMLLTKRIYGFVLRSRKWFLLDVDKIVPIRRHDEGFQSLILPPDVSRLVEGLVQTHSPGTKPTIVGAEPEHQVDLVRGKGKGLIILLHGAPGVGKTSTAECVADYTHRPLFPLTCGDIGETAKDVEQNLEQNFSLAHRWGCVLLLDEADVFLQARDKEDMRRNSVVSVFLRVLEYYSGILFLTTNKVGHFDEAFKSRIHVSLYYPPLDKKSTLKVWKMNINRLIEQKRIDVEYDSIAEYAKQHYKALFKAKRTTWNGRQIKNAFQTAMALAEFDAKIKRQAKPVLTKEHFEVVAKASEGFDEYLFRLHGTDAERARLEGGRYDEPREQWTHSTTKKASKKYGSSDSDSSSEESEARQKRKRKEEKKTRKKAEQKAKTKSKGSDSDSSSSG